MSFSPSWHRPSVILALFIAYGSAATPAIAQVPDKNALLSVHRQLLESVFLRGDTTLIAATALPNLVVVPPGGIVETDSSCWMVYAILYQTRWPSTT